MKDHLNLFEYYSQVGALPIENNSTRNLGIVIKNNLTVLFSFLDLIGEKSNVDIQKPAYQDDWFLKLQVKVKNLAKDKIEIKNVIGMTLTTAHSEFYDLENSDTDAESITDMVVYSNGTLIIVEAKKDSTDATKQLKKQVLELKGEWEKNGFEDFDNPIYISVTWDDVVERLNNINTLTDGKDAILNDYIEHIKNSIPAFFPVQTFDKLNENDSEHIKRRIERFARNYDTEIIARNGTGDTLYWVRLLEKEYVKELVYQSYDKNLRLSFYPGNTMGQGHSLFGGNNKLSILNTANEHSIICVDKRNLKLSLRPSLKVSNAWGKGAFDIDVNIFDKNTLKDIFNNLCGKRKSANNLELTKAFEEYDGKISTKSFEENFKESFKNVDHNYTFILSLTIGINIENMYEVLKEIDKTNPVSPNTDSVVDFTGRIVDKIYDLIEN